jgi:hypothetical protein
MYFLVVKLSVCTYLFNPLRLFCCFREFLGRIYSFLVLCLIRLLFLLSYMEVLSVRFLANVAVFWLPERCILCDVCTVDTDVNYIL